MAQVGWRGLAAACAQDGPCFAFHAIDARELARREHASRQGWGGPAGPLRAYLHGFEASMGPPRFRPVIPKPINCARVRRLSWAQQEPKDMAAIRDVPFCVRVGLDPSKTTIS